MNLDAFYFCMWEVSLMMILLGTAVTAGLLDSINPSTKFLFPVLLLFSQLC